MQRLNVRSGPGLTFDSLGVLESATVVALTGKIPLLPGSRLIILPDPAGAVG